MPPTVEKIDDIPVLTAELVSESGIAVTKIIVVESEIIATTKDRLVVALDYALRKGQLRSAWLGPFGVLVSIIAVLAAAEFNDFIVPACVWRAIFITGLVIFSALTLALGLIGFKARDKGSLILKALYYLERKIKIETILE